MRNIVTFSGGKDSLASLIWAEANIEEYEVVFCDTGWEHEHTYNHIKYVMNKLGKELITIRSKKYKGFEDMSLHKKRVASTKARFCTEELKVKPMIDYILTIQDDVRIIQGIRADESLNRSKMKDNDEYFSLYISEKKGLYKKKDVIKHIDNFTVDVVRPIFRWSANEVFKYIASNGYEYNPLYRQGFSRVGCFPCVMARHSEVKQMIEKYPNYFERLEKLEKDVGRTFFPPNYIPAYACTKKVTKIEEVVIDGEVTEVDRIIKVPTALDVKRYLLRNGKEIFSPPSCQSIYAICE